MIHAFNILLAEDNADDVFLLHQAFKKAGVTSSMQVVQNGVEAVAYLSNEGAFANRTTYPMPDMLLLDLNMPQRNGFEVLEWLRKSPTCQRLVVHVLTASCREADVRRAYELGANSYILKPSRMDELTAWVKALHEWHHFVVLPANEQKPAANAS
jgi:CheY-like chemotaxis protein